MIPTTACGTLKKVGERADRLSQGSTARSGFPLSPYRSPRARATGPIQHRRRRVRTDQRAEKADRFVGHVQRLLRRPRSLSIAARLFSARAKSGKTRRGARGQRAVEADRLFRRVQRLFAPPQIAQHLARCSASGPNRGGRRQGAPRPAPGRCGPLLRPRSAPPRAAQIAEPQGKVVQRTGHVGDERRRGAPRRGCGKGGLPLRRRSAPLRAAPNR